MDGQAVSSSLAERFFQLFAGMDKAYGTYRVTSTRIRDGKKIGEAYTKRDDVTLELWEKHLCGEQCLGIIPIRDGNTCLFGAIDIDDYQGTTHSAIAKNLRRLNLPLFVCRSKSGGAHLYLFTEKPVQAKAMQDRLREIASLIGFGESEIFPKQTKILIQQGDVGQWINMPYFNGMKGMRYCVDESGNALSPEEFFHAAKEKIVPLAWFDESLVTVEDFLDGPPCLQSLAHLGYPEGTRNDGLYQIGVFLKMSAPDIWERELDVYNHRYMTPPLSITEIQGIAKSLKRKTYKYTCTKQGIASHCNAALCRTKRYGVGGGANTRFPTLGGLTKLGTTPPIWFWTVDEARLELTTRQLQDPRSFQMRCMEVLNLMPPVPSTAVWRAAVQNAMDSVTVVEAPKDASQEGQFWEMVEKFCLGRAQGLSKDEIILGKPYTEENQTHFRLVDLLAFLERHKMREFKPNKIAALLKEGGAKHHGANFKGRFVNYWSIPAFVEQKEDFAVPEEAGDRKEHF